MATVLVITCLAMQQHSLVRHCQVQQRPALYFSSSVPSMSDPAFLATPRTHQTSRSTCCNGHASISRITPGSDWLPTVNPITWLSR